MGLTKKVEHALRKDLEIVESRLEHIERIFSDTNPSICAEPINRRVITANYLDPEVVYDADLELRANQSEYGYFLDIRETIDCVLAEGGMTREQSQVFNGRYNIPILKE